MSPLRRLKIGTELSDSLGKLSPTIKTKVRAGFDALLNNPYEGKSLRAELTGLWSLRVGRFRVIYRWSGSVLEIVAVGPRESIYPEVAKRLKTINEDLT